MLCHALLKYECGKLTATAAAAAFAATATTVSQKNLQLIFYDNFGKCRPVSYFFRRYIQKSTVEEAGIKTSLQICCRTALRKVIVHLHGFTTVNSDESDWKIFRTKRATYNMLLSVCMHALSRARHATVCIVYRFMLCQINATISQRRNDGSFRKKK